MLVICESSFKVIVAVAVDTIRLMRCKHSKRGLIQPLCPHHSLDLAAPVAHALRLSVTQWIETFEAVSCRKAKANVVVGYQSDFQKLAAIVTSRQVLCPPLCCLLG